MAEIDTQNERVFSNTNPFSEMTNPGNYGFMDLVNISWERTQRGQREVYDICGMVWDQSPQELELIVDKEVARKHSKDLHTEPCTILGGLSFITVPYNEIVSLVRIFR